MKFLEDPEIKADYYMFKLDANSKILEECLEQVRAYIIENELLIVGGMAIDLALKTQQDGIYSLYEIPDYDIISPENVRHANAVGQILCKLGIQDVAVIPAVHKTTMRVQVAGYTVFDATYLPQAIYDKIPKLDCEPFIVIHPIYQKIDQLLSIAMAWEITGPDFNYFNRMTKDLSRREMLSKYFNLEKLKETAFETKKAKYVAQEIVEGPAYNLDISYVWSGQVAYGIYAKKYPEMFSIGEYQYVNSYEVLVQTPPTKYTSYVKGYSAVMPDCYIEGDCKYFVLSNFTVNCIDGIYVASPYYVAAYCLYMSFHSTNPIWNLMYHGMLKMMNNSEICDSVMTVGIQFWRDTFFEKNYESMVKTGKPLEGVPPKNYPTQPSCDIRKQFDQEKSEFY